MMASHTGATPSRFAWRSAPDWVQLGIAAVLFLAAIFSPNEGASYFNIVWGIITSAGLAALAIWALAQTIPTASIAQSIMGSVIFVMPWFGGTNGGWSWLAWLGGAVVILVGVWSYFSMPTGTAQHQ